MTKQPAYIGLGSNIRPRKTVLEQAIEKVAALPESALVKRSSWYETQAVGGVASGDFINGAVLLHTTLPPRTLLEHLNKIERDLGRIRYQKWSDRTCDLDLLAYGELTLDEPLLCLPHPRIVERAFVLAPLAEIAPNLVLPGKTETVLELLRSCNDAHWVRIVEYARIS